MLVSDESENIPASLLLESESSTDRFPGSDLDAVDLTSSSKVKVERNRSGIFTQVIDLSHVNFGDDEVLDLSKSKEALTVGEDNKLIISELNIPPADNRPKYSLNSLIEALRNTIEQDRKDKPAKQRGYDVTMDTSAEEEDSRIFRDLSSDSSDEHESDGEFQVSVKTIEVEGKTMYKCSKCKKTFSKACTFAKHAMIHAKLYPYQCGICNLKYKDMRVLLKHLDWHGENVDCPCQKCEKVEEGKPEEKSKELEGNKECRFKCDICGKAFISGEVCKAHVNMHQKDETLKCEVCNMKYTCHRLLNKHRKTAHSVQLCPYCYESCPDLTAHFKKHEGAFLYRCGLCSDGFNSRPHLHEHIKIHTLLGKVDEGESSGNQPKSKASQKVKKDSGETAGNKKSRASSTGSKKVSDKIKVETFEKDELGRSITRAIILNAEAAGVTANEEASASENIDDGQSADATFVDLNFYTMPEEASELSDNQGFEFNVTVPTTVMEAIEGKKDSENSKSQEADLLCTSEKHVPTQSDIRMEQSSGDEKALPESENENRTIQDADQQDHETQETHTGTSETGQPTIEQVTKPVETTSPAPQPTGGTSMSLRRRSTRRCRWHDNDSVCERCDNTFVRKIAFGRKPKRGRESPRVSEDNLNFPIIENYHEGIEDDGLTLPPSLTAASHAQ